MSEFLPGGPHIPLGTRPADVGSAVYRARVLRGHGREHDRRLGEDERVRVRAGELGEHMDPTISKTVIVLSSRGDGAGGQGESVPDGAATRVCHPDEGVAPETWEGEEGVQVRDPVHDRWQDGSMNIRGAITSGWRDGTHCRTRQSLGVHRSPCVRRGDGGSAWQPRHGWESRSTIFRVCHR